jgi:hypothetical protein
MGLDLARVAAVYDLPHLRGSSGWIGWPTPRPRTALIEISVDRRRNVELHRRIADRVGEALGARDAA